MSEEKKDKKVNLHEGHRARMRERFRKSGFKDFNDHQIIELLLFYTCPRIDTNELAHKLVNRFGSIARILDASYEDLMEIKGISENTATLFKIIPNFLPVYYNSLTSSNTYENVERLKELFKPYFVGLDHEEMRLACFDNNIRCISNVQISSGSPSSSPFEMRKIAEEVFKAKASYAVIAHNHPKGTPVPSESDIAATRFISDTLRAFNVKLFDHIIVGERSALSMKEMAYINIFD
ncbi:MAG: hypothetical protein K2N60_09725 [Oscillospiraceae bacterium]|nr:hypothetical protein [Oscillospiraceae bacterium]